MCVCVCVCDEYGVQNNAQVCTFMHKYTCENSVRNKNPESLQAQLVCACVLVCVLVCVYNEYG